MHVVTPTGLVTFGLSTNLKEGMTPALNDMVSWIQVLYEGPRARTLALASATVDLRITQVTSLVWEFTPSCTSGVLRSHRPQPDRASQSMIEKNGYRQ